MRSFEGFSALLCFDSHPFEGFVVVPVSLGHGCGFFVVLMGHGRVGHDLLSDPTNGVAVGSSCYGSNESTSGVPALNPRGCAKTFHILQSVLVYGLSESQSGRNRG